MAVGDAAPIERTEATPPTMVATVDRVGRSAARRGFTLVELMIVLLVIAISASLVSVALQDGAQTRLDQEAARLAALLEGARAESRALGVAVSWQPASADDATPDAAPFRFVGLPGGTDMPSRWLHEGVTAEIVGARALILGPEPLIGPQRVVLQLEERRAVIATDGLGPFGLVGDEP